MSENENIHESDTGVQAFDVTPHTSDDNNVTTMPTPSVPDSVTDSAVAEGTNAYDTIIQQQKEQIDALIEHTERLNKQIAQMVHGGVQVNDGTQAQPQPQPQPQTQSLADDYVSLSDLGAEIGKKER